MYSTHGSRDGWSSVPVDASPEHQELAQLQEQIVQLQRETSPDTTQRESSEVEQPERQAEQDGFLQGIAQQADGVPVFPLEKLIGQDFSSVVAAIEQLDPQMELSRTDELTNALVLLGEKSPRDVVQCIALLQGNENDSETSAHFRLFRKLDKQPQLSPCGNWHYLRKPIDTVLGWAVSASIDGTSDAPWDEYLGEGFQIPAHEKYESEKCERQVLMLAGFSAMPSDSEGSPYARLFRALEKLPEQQLNALISTDLMATTTEFKWNAFARRLLLGKLVRFMAHFLLAGVGMVMSTQSAGKEKDGTLNAADILVLCLLFTNSTMLYHEVRQMRLDGFPVYLSDGWNLCDLSGIVALYTACVAHWLNHASMVESVGSVGLLFNCFSVLPLLMPFRMTGLLVRTFVGMMSNPDINGFFVVSAIMVWGFAMAFAVSMPKSEALFGDAGGGPLVSVLTAFEAMLGAFHLSNYQGQTLAYFLLFLFVMVVVGLNLLIAVLSDCYTDTKETLFELLPTEKARSIVEVEAEMSDQDKSNEMYFPRYLQILRRSETRNGQGQQANGREIVARDEIVEVTRAVVAQVEAKVDQLSHSNDHLAAEVSEVKALLQHLASEVRALR